MVAAVGSENLYFGIPKMFAHGGVLFLLSRKMGFEVNFEFLTS